MSPSDERVAKVSSVLSRRQPDLTVVMENIHDPHNVSAIFRTCDAVGVLQVELVYTEEKFPTIGKKSSSSANKWLLRRKHRSRKECIKTLKNEGFVIYATHLGNQSHSLYELSLVQKVALVFGNEHRGVSDEMASLADGNFVIPMMGMIQSLNVSVAAAVSLYEALRQRSLAGQFDTPKLAKENLGRLTDVWLRR